MQQTHIIHRQRLELDLQNEQSASQVERDWSRWYQKQLLPKLEKRLSALMPADRFLKIERLEVDLGDIIGCKTDKSLTDHCIQVFEKALMHQLSDCHTEGYVSREANAMTAFLNFLQTGYHAEWLAREPKLLEIDILHALNADFPKYEQAILQVLNSGKGCIRRLVWQFPDVFLEKLILKLFKFDWMDELTLFHQLDRAYRKDLLAEIIELAVLDTPLSANKLLIALETYMEHNLREHYSESAMVELRNEILGGRVLRYDRRVKLLLMEQDIFIQNAGLILLHPFLYELAKELNCLDNDGFRSKTMQFRAIHVFQFLCTGVLNAAEYALMLNKILCGLPLQQPIERELPISTDAIMVLEGLLESIIESEPIFGNMTLKQFRERFLQRRGKLTRSPAGNDWLLYVEKRANDYLEDYFKWDYSVIKLPWMNENLYVIW
jgi:Contractile injection system tape measure protein